MVESPIQIFRNAVLDLVRAGVSKAQIARELGMSRVNLWRMMTESQDVKGRVYQKIEALRAKYGV